MVDEHCQNIAIKWDGYTFSEFNIRFNCWTSSSRKFKDLIVCMRECFSSSKWWKFFSSLSSRFWLTPTSLRWLSFKRSYLCFNSSNCSATLHSDSSSMTKSAIQKLKSLTHVYCWLILLWYWHLKKVFNFLRKVWWKTSRPAAGMLSSSTNKDKLELAARRTFSQQPTTSVPVFYKTNKSGE